MRPATRLPTCLTRLLPGALGALLAAATGIAGAANDLPAVPASEANAAAEQALAASKPADEAAPVNVFPQSYTAEGIQIEFSLANRDPKADLFETEQVEVAFRMTDAGSGEPVSGLYPVVWVDLEDNYLLQSQGKNLDCRGRVGVYLQGLVGIRPLIDLNSYFLMVMNADPTISVYDPIVGVQGATNLFAQIVLKRRGADWAKTSDDKRMYVSMPVADQVAIIDTEKFIVVGNISAGDKPTRLRMQPDEKYLWIGNDGTNPDTSGVTVFDLAERKIAKFIPTGAGHHEIEISPDNRFAFVSNRKGGTVSVIDIATLTKLEDIRTGPEPISLAWSSAGDALYVSDAQDGRVSVISGDEPSITARIELAPGLGPMRFSKDGRWGVVVNSNEDEVYVIDPAINEVRRSVKVTGRPYQVAFSDAFAYVRALESERVTMINLDGIGKAESLPVLSFPAGGKAPGNVRDLSFADGIVPAPGEAAVMVVNPADNTVYYYMEGMNAPMGAISDPALQRSGHRAMAVNVVDRTLRETEPGLYTSKVKVPVSGKYSVAFLLDSPRVLNCFAFEAKPHPMLAKKVDPLAIEYLVKDRRIPVGESITLQFKLTEPETGKPPADMESVQVMYSAVGGVGRRKVNARPVGDGVYEVDVLAPRPGAYYVWVAAPEKQVGFQDLPYIGLRAMAK